VTLRERRGRWSGLASADRETASPALTYLQAQLYRDFVSKFLQRAAQPESQGGDHPGRAGGAPTQVRRQHWRVPPADPTKVDIWEREGARQFVTELRSVDPAVTGSPVITYEATRLMERG